MKKNAVLGVVIILLFLFSFNIPAGADVEQKIIINKATNQLSYFEGGELIRHFPVATGKTPSLTPEGEFKIAAKLVNPYYRAQNIPGGDPKNPLGVRWLGLDARGTKGDTYGIHGNSNPDSIGKYISLGCIRMYNKDVIWLYDRVVIGTPVNIINDESTAVKKEGQEILLDINVNGSLLQKKNYLLDGVSYTSVKELAEALDYRVFWDAETRRAYIYDENTVLIFSPGGKTTLNGKTVDGITSELKENMLYVPVRFAAEALGAKVSWDEQTLTVFINK